MSRVRALATMVGMEPTAPLSAVTAIALLGAVVYGLFAALAILFG
jgi:hypothetical protein